MITAPKFHYFLLPLCLGAWGCLLLKLHQSGQLNQLQNPAYHTITLSFSIILLVISAAYPFLFNPPPLSNSLVKSLSWGRGILLCVPLAAFLSLPEDLFTASLLRQRSSSNLLSPGALQRFLPGKPGELHQALLEQVESSSKEQPVSLDLLELVYLSQDPELRRRYDGQKVSIPGQWLAEDAEHFKIARLLIFCCAADGRTITLRIHGKTSIKEDGTWIEISGTLHFKENQPVPEVDLESYSRSNGPPDGGT